jgi:mannose-6-phosphate isomerase-like protein (cupin superfamily)
MEQTGVIHRPHEGDEYYFEEGCHILEIWNRPDDTALSVARARLGPGLTTRLHRLAETVERYLILSGEGRVEVDGLSPQAVGPGDFVLIPAGHGQRITNLGEGDLVFLALCTPRFTPDVYADIDPTPLEPG